MGNQSANRIIVIDGNELERIIEQCIQSQVQQIIDMMENINNKLVGEKDKTTSMNDLINTDTVAEILQCSRPSVYKLRKLKQITPVIILGRVFYKKSEILKLIR